MPPRQNRRVPLLVRTWNLFHGNAYPPERRAFLAEMIRLGTQGADVLCVQELPVWSLRRLESWSGMTVVPAVSATPVLPSALARPLTELHHGVFRSALVGQANAILLARRLRVCENKVAPLDTLKRRNTMRRVAQAVLVDGGIAIGNLHASGPRVDPARKQIDRARDLVESLGARVTILAGDFNSRPDLPGYSAPAAEGIDHVLVRGASAGPPVVWPAERRTVGGRLLSDHPPVEVTVDV